MLVTGIQAVGAKGFTTVQVAASDPRDAARGRAGAEARATTPTRAGEPQPVVFPRSGPSVDQRPVSMRRLKAAERYRRDGDDPAGDGDPRPDGQARDDGR